MSLKKLLKERKYELIKRPSLAMRFLYDADEFYRFRGAEALGVLCKGRIARNFILRLFWHLSDESGAYCIAAPLGIAEIGRSNPKEFEGFKNKFVSLLDDWEVERKYVAYGIFRLGDIVRDAYPDPVEKLAQLVGKLKPEFTAYALLALYKLDKNVAKKFMEEYKQSDDIVRFYDGEAVKTLRLRDTINLIKRIA